MTGGADRDLERELGLLEGAGLITRAVSARELEYVFRHALIQDATYASLLKEERRSLHLDVAEALLAIYPDRREELAPVLAHHFELAGDRPRAIEHLALAARQARARYARHEALEFARRAVVLLGDDDAIDTHGRRLRAEMRWLQAEAGLGFVPLNDTLTILEAAITDGEAAGDPVIAAKAYLEIAQARALGGEQHGTSPELADALRHATELAEASGSAELIALARLRSGQAHYASSEFGEAIRGMEQAIPALVEAGRFYDASVAAGQLGAALGHIGDFDQAVAWTDRSRQLGVESGDPNASLDADLMRSIVEGIRGDSAAAIDYATRAAEAAERVDNKACAMVAQSVIGEQHLRDGDADQAAIAFEASADLATFCQFMPVKIEQTELLLQTARTRSGVGRVEFERYERAIELAREFGDRLAEAQLYEQRARDRLEAGQATTACDDLTTAVDLFGSLDATADLHRAEALRLSISSSGRS